MKPRILYEDSELMVIDKPAGMVVNRSESAKRETVQDWLQSSGVLSRVFPPASARRSPARVSGSLPPAPPPSDFVNRSGIVHRLDKETSGVLVIAKTEDAFENLQSQFKERKVEKSYIALVHGKVTPEEGKIDAPVGRLPWNRERFGVLAGGREAETKYRVESRKYRVSGDKREEFSLLELYPKTGRTHQLRVHLKSIGHPIVGDTFYAGRKTARRDREWCPRLFLHAQSISFTHPTRGEQLTIKSTLSEDLVGVLEHIS